MTKGSFANYVTQKNDFFEPPSLLHCHKFSKERALLYLDCHKFSYNPPPFPIICERPIIGMKFYWKLTGIHIAILFHRSRVEVTWRPCGWLLWSIFCLITKEKPFNWHEKSVPIEDFSKDRKMNEVARRRGTRH